MNVVDSYSRDIGMEYGMDKCAVLTMKRGQRVADRSELSYRVSPLSPLL